jgi:hypothetical protein
VIACLDEIDSCRANSVNEPMFLCDSSGPSAGQDILQRFGLADAYKGIPENSLD